MTMKLSYNQTLKQSTLEEDLHYCKKYGYDAIELRIDKLRDYLKRYTVDDLSDHLQSHGLKPYSLNSIEGVTFIDEKCYVKLKEDLDFLCKVGNKIDCDTIVVVPSFEVGDYTVSQIKEESIRVLNEIADHVEQYNLRLAFEFIGHPGCSVNTFNQCYDIIKEINRESVGMVLDFFHFYSLGSSIYDLKRADVSKIFIVHIDDAEDLPRGTLEESKHRLFPGDGVINIGEILQTLNKMGFKGTISIELFREEYDKWDVEEFIKVAKEKTVQVLNNCFSVR